MLARGARVRLLFLASVGLCGFRRRCCVGCHVVVLTCNCNCYVGKRGEKKEGLLFTGSCIFRGLRGYSLCVLVYLFIADFVI